MKTLGMLQKEILYDRKMEDEKGEEEKVGCGGLLHRVVLCMYYFASNPVGLSCVKRRETGSQTFRDRSEEEESGEIPSVSFFPMYSSGKG